MGCERELRAGRPGGPDRRAPGRDQPVGARREVAASAGHGGDVPPPRRLHGARASPTASTTTGSTATSPAAGPRRAPTSICSSSCSRSSWRCASRTPGSRPAASRSASPTCTTAARSRWSRFTDCGPLPRPEPEPANRHGPAGGPARGLFRRVTSGRDEPGPDAAGRRGTGRLPPFSCPAASWLRRRAASARPPARPPCGSRRARGGRRDPRRCPSGRRRTDP